MEHTFLFNNAGRYSTFIYISPVNNQLEEFPYHELDTRCIPHSIRCCDVDDMSEKYPIRPHPGIWLCGGICFPHGVNEELNQSNTGERIIRGGLNREFSKSKGDTTRPTPLI